MKTTLIRIVNVSDKFKSLSKKRYQNWNISFKLARAYKEIKENTDLYLEKERDLITQYVMRNEDGSFKFEKGAPQFETVEKAEEFQTELSSLQKTEVEICDPIDIHVSDFKYSEEVLTPEEILELDGFVKFICEDDTNESNQ